MIHIFLGASRCVCVCCHVDCHGLHPPNIARLFHAFCILRKFTLALSSNQEHAVDGHFATQFSVRAAVYTGIRVSVTLAKWRAASMHIDTGQCASMYVCGTLLLVYCDILSLFKKKRPLP